MATSIMHHSAASVPSSPGKSTAAGQARVSLREWLDVFKSVLAMASAMTTSGHVGAKQVAQVCAMAAKL